MSLPTSDGKAIDYNLIPGFTSAWAAGYGGTGFNTPATASPLFLDTVPEPEEKPAATPGRRSARKK